MLFEAKMEDGQVVTEDGMKTTLTVFQRLLLEIAQKFQAEGWRTNRIVDELMRARMMMQAAWSSIGSASVLLRELNENPR